MIEAHYVKSTVQIWLPEPHGKGANAEAGAMASTQLATQITSVLLSHKNAECYSF